MMGSHSGVRIALIVATLVFYAITLFISYLSSSEFGRDIGWFKNNTGDVSDVFILIITPAGWTFTIWGFIYTWQALWLIYAQTTICRTNNDGTPIYMLPQHSSIVYLFFMLNNAFIITWTFLWDRQHVGWACIAIVFTPLTLYVCLFVSHRRLYNSLTILRSGGLTKEIWLIRGLIQNGIAFFATWVTIATLLNFAMVLHYVWDVKMETSCIVSLALLGGIILKWFIVETFIFDKYVRYTMSPYIVLILGLAGSLSKNFDLDKNYTTSIMTVVLISAAGLLAIVKVFVVVYRHRKYPIKGTASDDVKGTLA